MATDKQLREAMNDMEAMMHDIVAPTVTYELRGREYRCSHPANYLRPLEPVGGDDDCLDVGSLSDDEIETVIKAQAECFRLNAKRRRGGIN